MGRRKKKRIFEQVQITGLADRGKGVGRTPDGKVVFVENAVPGDVVDVLVRKKRSSYFVGRCIHVHRYSEHRVEPFCAHFGTCGGCKMQHVPYEKQLEYKDQTVRDALQRIGKVDVKAFLPIVPAPDTQYYRNKLEFTFSNRRWLTPEELNVEAISNEQDVLGFHPPGAFDKIIDIQHCYLQPDPSNALRLHIKAVAQELGLSFYDIRAQKGMMRNVIFRITSLGEVMVLVSFWKNDPKIIATFFEQLLAQVPQITSVYYCINPKKNDFILDLEMVHYHGKAWIEEVLGNVRFRIGPKSFFQTNSKQAVRLFDVVEKMAHLTGNENVYDLYTGIGSIALYLARQCRQVVGIEEIGLAIEDARRNATLNNIQNALFYAGDVKDILTTEFAQKHGRPDILITDPPRAGMHPKVVEMLLQLEAPKVVYVSCNPATQARDLLLLSEKYEVRQSQAVDMFPHTHHIENVVVLQKRDTI